MAYLQGHDHIPCPIFQRHDGSPLPLSVFCEKHSLYIETASNSTDKGMSDAQIRTWVLEVRFLFRGYLHPSHVQLAVAAGRV